MDTCGRCNDTIDAKRPQVCVWCKGDLCLPCWEALGHCGHPEMDVINADMQTASPERRRAMMQALGPIDEEGKPGEQLDDDLPDPKAN